jgi:hypothetical protein
MGCEGVGAHESVWVCACKWIAGSVQVGVGPNEWLLGHPLRHTLKIYVVVKSLPLVYYTKSTQIPQL